VLQFQLDPGTAFGYSGEGLEYTKRFAEKKFATPWKALASQYVFEPFGME
jgi:CubicO group peptidase (beta-lactamase class C family)